VIQGILSLPNGLGMIVFILLVTVIGLLPYFVARGLIRRYLTSEVKEVAHNLFRISGALLALLLSLIFADVRADLMTLRNSIQMEAVRISDIYGDLNHFDTPESKALQAQLVEYLIDIKDDEWALLSEDRLSRKAGNLYDEIQEGILGIEAKTSGDEALLGSILSDFDQLADLRQQRWYYASADAPDFLYIALVGFVFTMGLLSIYPPQPASVILICCYCAVVGIVLYFILAMSDPFHGAMSVTPAPLEIIYQEYLATR